MRPGCRRCRDAAGAGDTLVRGRRRLVMSRLMLVLLTMVLTASAVIAYKDPEQAARASDIVSELLRHRAAAKAMSEVEVPRGQGGEFALKAKINGVAAPMVVDTGATSVVLTYETAKALGLPI